MLLWGGGVGVRAQVSNPMAEAVEFAVYLDGEGLLGDAGVVVPAGGSSKYEAIFAPLRAGAVQGAITFSNDDIGEFWCEEWMDGWMDGWMQARASGLDERVCDGRLRVLARYDVSMVAEDAPPMDVEPVTVPVGSTGIVYCMLENPTAEAVTFTGKSSNRLFVVEDTVVNAYESKRAKVLYTPRSVEADDTSTVKFAHPKCGKFVFNCRGSGSRPTGFGETLSINATLGQSTSHLISFENPFDHALNLDCIVDDAEEGGGAQAFRLVLQHHRVQVSRPGPFILNPRTLNR